MSGQQFFSEKEVGEIVRRAADLQERLAGSEAPYAPGISREELSRVAREMGIDPVYLERAINETGEDDGTGGRFLGAELTRDFERVIPGELPPEDFDVVLEEIGPRRRGQFTSQVGRSLNTTVTAGLGYGRLMVSSREGRTRLVAKSIGLLPGLATLYPAFILSMAGAAAIAESVHGPRGAALAIGVVFAVCSVAWAGFAALTRKAHRSIAEVVDRIERRIASANLSGRKPQGKD